MDRKITIGMAEDHLVFRQGLISLLKEEESIKVLFDVNNGQKLLEKIGQEKPDVVLLDIEMPIMNGYDALKHILDKYPEVRVIVLTTHFHPLYIISFLQEGASAFLPKEAGIMEIVRAIKSVYSKGFYHSNQVLEIIDAHSRVETEENAKFLKAGLTNREVQILKLLRNSSGNDVIAKTLNISLRTVEWHRYNLNLKLKENGMAEYINWSRRNLN